MNISSPVFINDSLCNYYKRVWSKCRKLLNGGFMNGFWFTGRTFRLKLTESSPARNVSHLVDLEELFPGNPILKDEQIFSHFAYCCVFNFFVVHRVYFEV